MNLIKKLSVATLFGKPLLYLTSKQDDPDFAKTYYPLIEIYGFANTYRVVDGKDGFKPSVEFVGSFLGTNLVDGSEAVAPKAFFMEPVDLLIKASIDAGVAMVEIGVRVSAKYDATSVTSYVYETEVLHLPAAEEAANPLKALRQRTLALIDAPESKNK